jgi:hypothetical protein
MHYAARIIKPTPSGQLLSPSSKIVGPALYEYRAIEAEKAVAIDQHYG